jgi:O-antigen/teichoic acid export membrane protein
MGDRNRTILIQASAGLVLRIGSVAFLFAAMPMTLSALGASEMGVWLVLLSVFQWITLFDLGIGAGARNEIARAVAKSGADQLKRTISTGWYYCFIISLTLFTFISLIMVTTPLEQKVSSIIFNGTNIDIALWLIFTCACVSFVLNFAQVVFSALEKPVATSVYAFISNVLFLTFISIFGRYFTISLVGVAVLYVVSMISASLFVLLWYRRTHPNLWPSHDAVDQSLRNSIVGGGLKLFVIQLCALLIFTIDRALVSAFVGPEAVVGYDAASRIFALIIMSHTLLVSSAWSSFTQAHAKNDWEWMSSTVKRLAYLSVPVALIAAAVALVGAQLVRAWLGADQVGPLELYASFAIATVMACWSNVFSYFLSAIGETSAQIRSALIAVVLNVPFSYFFSVELQIGAAGVVMGTCVSLLVFSVVGPIVTFRKFKEVFGKKQSQAGLEV